MLERLLLACTLVLSLYLFVQPGTSTPPALLGNQTVNGPNIAIQSGGF